MTVFKTMIGIMEGQIENVKKVCDGIKSRDQTFEYMIVEPEVPSIRRKFERLLIIHSSTKDEANRRGGWFIHKCKSAKVSSYFWVKEG